MGPQKIVSQGIVEKLCLKVLSGTAGDVIMCSWGDVPKDRTIEKKIKLVLTTYSDFMQGF